jgi:hypothetical protein
MYVYKWTYFVGRHMGCFEAQTDREQTLSWKVWWRILESKGLLIIGVNKMLLSNSPHYYKSSRGFRYCQHSTGSWWQVLLPPLNTPFRGRFCFIPLLHPSSYFTPRRIWTVLYSLVVP